MTAPDPSIARAHMVDSQVRPNQVNDPRIISAMRSLPREDFAPPGSLAYADADIDLGGGRYLLAPLTIARLTQLVMANNPKSILVIAAGTGYGAAILAASGAAVTALEEDPRLETGALLIHGKTVRRLLGKLEAGDPRAAPYDAILIEGAVPAIPAALATQLAPHGRLVTILTDDPGAASTGRAGLGRAVIAESRGEGFATAPKFDVTARVIPQFRAAPAFVF
jgi:protein-L-isoaspartate(D-aspartate) O-methyltransferase